MILMMMIMFLVIVHTHIVFHMNSLDKDEDLAHSSCRSLLVLLARLIEVWLFAWSASLIFVHLSVRGESWGHNNYNIQTQLACVQMWDWGKGNEWKKLFVERTTRSPWVEIDQVNQLKRIQLKNWAYRGILFFRFSSILQQNFDDIEVASGWR